MNTPKNLYCRAWQYLFEIVTVAKNDCILTDSDRGSQRCYCNRFLPALCRSIFLRWRKQLSVLFGLIVGHIVAIAMGVVDFSALQGTSIIALPRLMPFKPEFNLNAIIMILAGIFPFFGALLATLPDAVLVCLCILRWKQGGTWYYQSLILMCIKSPIRFSLYP